MVFMVVCTVPVNSPRDARSSPVSSVFERGEIGAPALAQETLIVGLALYQPQEQDKRQEREHECRGGKGKDPFIHK